VTILDRLNADLKTAMRSRDAERLSTLRMAISAMTYRRIERNEQLSEEDQADVLRKQVKQRDDAIEEFTKGGRPELAAKELREREILSTYLPAELTPEELRAQVHQMLAPLGQPLAFGAAMKAVMAQLKDRASGKAIQEAVREALAAKQA